MILQVNVYPEKLLQAFEVVGHFSLNYMRLRSGRVEVRRRLIVHGPGSIEVPYSSALPLSLSTPGGYQEVNHYIFTIPSLYVHGRFTEAPL
jgi:hypothetical protein